MSIGLVIYIVIYILKLWFAGEIKKQILTHLLEFHLEL